jgi:hypothetical protein
VRVTAWLGLLLAGCYLPRQKVELLVELPPELASGAAQVEVLPHIAEVRRSSQRAALRLELLRDAGKVRLVLPGACPLVIDTRALSAGATSRLQPLFDVGPRERVVGLGQRFELVATPRCREAEAARTSFDVTGGAALTHVSRGARRLTATTSAVAPAKAFGVGVVPVSAREAQKRRTVISFRLELPDGQRLARELGVSAVARASGLPNVGLNHPVLLSGRAWRLLDAPPGSRAALRPVGDVLELVPDLAGHYRLSDDAGRRLSLQSGRFDETPLDCGRSGCHAAISRSAKDSPMTQALASDLGGCHALTQPECASACHASGEPGVADGGFTHVMAELGLAALPAEYDDLPMALRRVGGVGCLSCHGPTQIPEPEARASILNNDVCAVCHDAPPRYGHVRSLEASRMGHADSLAETRREPCARCHTTWGALGRPAPPELTQGSGIGCVACHDVHPHGSTPPDASGAAPTHAGLLRALPIPSSIPSPPASLLGVSRVCVSCHAPSATAPRPEASAAALLAGQGGSEPKTGAPLALPSPHATDARGCLGCHDGGPDQLLLGKSHAFRANGEACARCHQTPPSRDPSLAERARRLLRRLDSDDAEASARPWHARGEPAAREPERARALRNVLLVLEDPAADVHHPSYAKALLDAAETFAKP